MNAKKKFLSKIFIFLSFIFILGISSFLGLYFYFANNLPDVSNLLSYSPPLPSQILSRDGEVLLSVGKEKRELIAIDRIPKIIINSFLAAEDANFYEHSGVDFFGIFRALLADLKAGKLVQGGSTITQQVAKSLLLSKEKSFIRKIKDALLAIEIEKKFTKDEILYLYLNHIYLGGGLYGVKSAFAGYFDKDLKEVTVAESALVAGLLVAPGKYSPYLRPKQAKARQIYVLGQMFSKKMIDKSTYEHALNEEVKIRFRKQYSIKAGYFTDWIRQKIIEKYGEEFFLSKGLTIQTSLDWSLQQKAEAALKKGLSELDRRQGYNAPKEKLNNAEEITSWVFNQRNELFGEFSQYFLLLKSGNIQYEIPEILSEVESLKSNSFLKRFSIGQFKFYLGNAEDRIFPILEKKKIVKAVVLGTDDDLGVIWASVGGIHIAIPEKFYKWAHPRKVSETVFFGGELKKPSKVFERGHIILVEIKQTDAHPKDFLDKKIYANLNSQSNASFFNQQKYVVAELTQDVTPQGAVIAIQHKTGEILTMVGGSNFQISQFNRALQSLRQPGSAFKVFIYSAALEKGHTAADILNDSPDAHIGGADGLNWRPKNYDNTFMGPLTLRRCIELSRNIPAIKMSADVGLPYLKSFVRRFGLNGKLEDDLTLALGSSGATLLELVRAYSVFPNYGKRTSLHPIKQIVDSTGKSYSGDELLNLNNFPKIDEFIKDKSANSYYAKLDDEQIYDPRLAYIMTKLLRGVIQNGTGSFAKDLGPFIGGKTGTTSSFVDSWFMGFSKDVTLGVWVGQDDNKTMGYGESGTKAALPIWKEIMRPVLESYGNADFEVPEGIVNAFINKETGRPTEQNDLSGFWESFVVGTDPNSKKPTEETQDNFSGVLDEDDYYRMQ